MSTLYIANLTAQPHEFQYRVPADEGRTLTRRVQTQKLAPGMQQMIHMETSLAVLEAIVDQHRKYGMVPASEAVRTKNFIGLAFQFDKPINLDQLEYAKDHNQNVLAEEGLARQEEVAIAAADGIHANAIQARRDGVPLPVPRAVVVEELEDADSPTFARGIRVDLGPTPPPNATDKNKGRRRRS